MPDRPASDTPAVPVPAQGDADAVALRRGPKAGFATGPVGRQLIRLGSYMAMGSLSINIAQLAEAVYLGILGTEALAAMGFAFPLMITLFAFSGGIGSGASSVIARAMGRGDRARARLLVTHAHLLALAIGCVLSLLAATYADGLVSALGARGEVLALTVAYLHVYLLGVPFFLLANVGSSLLRATGLSASPGIIMSGGSVIQILLGPVLIFGWFGVSEMGIKGAAWAYVISRVITFVLYAALLVRTRMMRFSLQDILGSWVAILHVGAPAVMSGMVSPVSMMIITRLLAGHGHEVVAGFNVASRVEMMAHMILWSASSSVEPFVGQNWGARQYQRVRRALFLTNGFCLGFGVVAALVMITLGGYLVGLIDDNPVVQGVAISYFWIVPVSLGFMGIMQVASSSFNARGLPLPSLAISLVRTLGLYVPLAILANAYWGYLGIFVASALTNVVAGAGAWYWNQRSVASAIRRHPVDPVH